MQALPCAAAGTRANNSGAKRALVHQHGAWGSPVRLRASIAQRLSAPQSGQRVGSTEGMEDAVMGAGMARCVRFGV